MSATPAPETNGKGIQIAKIEARLDGIADTLERIERKQDALSEWQRAVDARLAEGAEKFKTQGDEILRLRGRDTTVGLIGVIVTGIGSAIAAAIGRQP